MADSTTSSVSRKTWQEVAKEAQAHRDASIRHVDPPVPCVPNDLPLDVTNVPKTLLSTEEVLLTEASPEDLLDALASGRQSCSTVITAFLRRAGLAQALTNCITELLPSGAIERAKYLDEYWSQNRKPIGPLHGLPISVKEHIGMKGLGLNAGFVGWWDHKGQDDAHVLKILWDAGCVFYARTTEPQLLMHLETSSNLYGTTVNPFNTMLTPGGSSGGEGALLGLRGSCLGLGTDIGGSIRSPAANCGLYGLRPTSYRIPMDGLGAPMEGYEQIVPVLGPLSTSLEGIKIFMKTVIGAQPWLKEPALMPIPWRDQTSYLTTLKGKKLRVGVMMHDGVVKPHAPVTRALLEVVNKLKKVPGVEITEWVPYKHDEAWKIISTLYFPDGGAEERSVLSSSSEPILPLSSFILSHPNVQPLTIASLWQWTKKREQYRTAHAAHWNNTATTKNPTTGAPEGMVDVILCPAGPGAAPPLGNAKYWAYTAQWNLLDYPALVMPVTKVKEDEGRGMEEGEGVLGELDRENAALYRDPGLYRGAPVSVQIVGRRYEDEKVLEAAEFIQKQIGLPFL